MTTQRYIQSLRDRARSFDPPSVTEIETILVRVMETGLPDWESEGPDTILRRAIRLSAEQVQIIIGLERAQIQRALVAYAEGTDLDILGLGPPPVLRRIDEPDDDYRLRIIDSWSAESIGSISGVEDKVREFVANATDVKAVLSANRQDIALYALKANYEQLSSAEQMLLATSMSHPSNHIAGVNFVVREPEVIVVTVTPTIVHDPEIISEANANANTESAIATFFSQLTLGTTLYRSALEGAIVSLEGILDAVVTLTIGGVAQAGNLVPTVTYTNCQIYRLPPPE